MAQTKYRSPEFETLAAPATGSEARKAARQRGGAGKHDSRPNRQRTRATQMRAALRDAS